MKRWITSCSSFSPQDVFIVSYGQTPLGALGGRLKKFSAPQLGSLAIQHAVKKLQLESSLIQEVFMGCVVQGGIGQAPARQAAIFSGLDVSTPCTTVNKVCASGMKAIMLASQSLALGHKDIIVAGGMESLSNSSFYMSREKPMYGGLTLRDGCQFDALIDPYSGWHMGQCAEATVEEMNISKEEQDDYALESYKRTKEAHESKFLLDDLVLMEELTRDEESLQNKQNNLRETPTIWGKTITAGNSSKLADGAAAVILMNQNGLAKTGCQPLAKIIGYEDSAQSPKKWPTSPALGIKSLLRRFGLSVKEIANWEINEAFAAVVLANLRLLNITSTENVNRYGGAIAMGHPFGASGTRITHAVLKGCKNPGDFGIASLCNGGGGASSILLQKLN